MWRGLWLAALHDHLIMASSALTLSSDAVTRLSPSPFAAGLLQPNAGLIPWNIDTLRPVPSAAGLPAAVRGDHTQ
jgi:hypothetical protein